MQLTMFGNLQIEFFRAQRCQDDITAAIVGSGRRNRRQTQGYYRCHWKGSRAERVEIEEVDHGADEKKKEDEEKY